MKTVLMIAPYFIPRRRVGSLRPFKFAIHLREFGYQPVVLTISSPGNRYTELESNLLEKTPVIEIEPPFDRTSKQKNESKKDNRDSFFLDWLDKQTPLDSWIYLFLIRYFKIKKKVTELDPDIIWATGDPWSGLWLGEKLARSLSKPFVADYRDPWTIAEVNLRNRSSFSMKIDKMAESKIVMNADRIIFTSRLTEDNYLLEYNISDDKTKTIYNSYDSLLIKEYESENWGEKLNPKYLNLMFFGRFRRLSPVTPVAEAIKILKNSAPNDASKIHIHSFGIPDSESLRIIREYGLTNNFIFHEPVVPEKTIPVLQNADILLLSTNIKRQQVIPAKLWDYLAVEVPILSLTPNPEVGEIIMRNKAGIQVHPDKKSEIAELLQSFARAKQNEKSFLLSPDKDLPDRHMYEAKHTTGILASMFDELLKDG